MLWHYTDESAAAAIFISEELFASPARDGFPPGAYVSEITPVDRRHQRTLICSNSDPEFRLISTPDEDDYWYAPAEPPASVPIHPQGTGATLMDP
jgi:hypothetical protein